jgi:hypothetical protein
MSAHLRDGRWRDLDSATAMDLSSYFQARGRYELAEELHAIGTEWYEQVIVRKAPPGEINDHGETPGQILDEYRQRLAEFPLLAATRTRLLEKLSGRVEGIDRDKLKAIVKHEGSTTFGVICNQLARGEWIRQEKTGKKHMIYPANTAPQSDELYANAEMQRRAEANRRLAEMRYNPDDYEVMEAEPITCKPMTPELQAILDDARQAGYFVHDDHANDGSIVIRPYFEQELSEDYMLGPIVKPCGTPRVWEKEEGLPRGLTILPDHTARRTDVKYWLAEEITDYAVMRSVLGLKPGVGRAH